MPPANCANSSIPINPADRETTTAHTTTPRRARSPRVTCRAGRLCSRAFASWRAHGNPRGRPCATALTKSQGRSATRPVRRGTGIGELGSGAGGSRTRVPRSHEGWLYVRRFRMISDRGAPAPGSVRDPHHGKMSHDTPWSPCRGGKPCVVAAAPLQGIRGATSLQSSSESQVVLGVCGFRPVICGSWSTLPARSSQRGLTTVETVSAPWGWTRVLVRASTLWSCQ